MIRINNPGSGHGKCINKPVYLPRSLLYIYIFFFLCLCNIISIYAATFHFKVNVINEVMNAFTYSLLSSNCNKVDMVIYYYVLTACINLACVCIEMN